MKRNVLLILIVGVIFIAKAFSGEECQRVCHSCVSHHFGIRFTKHERGLLVTEVVPNSLAEEAGFIPGDIITEIDGEKATEETKMEEVLKKKRKGESVAFKILRGDEEKRLTVKIKEKRIHKVEVKFRGGGFGGFGPTISLFDFGKLNNLLLNNAFATTFSNKHWGFGGGGWLQAGKITIGGFGFGGSQSVGSDSLEVDGDFGVGFFEIGFIPFVTKFFNLRINLGIGGGGFTFYFKPNRSPPTKFEDLLKSPDFGTKINSGGFALAPGLSFDFPISFVGLSLKSGYIFFPKKSWEYEDGRDLNQGPDLNLSQPYIQLYIIFGGRG